MKIYAANNTNTIRRESSSGGIFYSLAEHVIANNGIVYGVAMSDDCYSAQFKRAAELEDLKKILGSKYLQASAGETFSSLKKDLADGKKVLFSGTGCQVNGLKYYLSRDYPNLICVDVICHGTPSQKLWEEYVKYIESKYKQKISYVNFRHKKNGWNNFGLMKNEIYHSKDIDSYLQLFLNNYCLRPSCYHCAAKKDKKADITLADFWGIGKVLPVLNDDEGTSLVLIRTDKGQELFDGISGSLKYEEVSYEAGVKVNPAEYRSTPRPSKRDSFFADMRELSYEDLVNKYIPVQKRITNRAKFIIRKILRFAKVMTRKGYSVK